MSDPKKARLSKSVLQMKFMKRTRDQVEKEDEELEGRSLYANEITDQMIVGNEHITIENSYVIIEGLHPCGRFSFGGMNKDIERIMDHEGQAMRVKKEQEELKKKKEMKKDVNDEDMVKYYSSLVQTLGGKFKGNFSNNRQNRLRNQQPRIGPPGTFWKPSDD